MSVGVHVRYDSALTLTTVTDRRYNSPLLPDKGLVYLSCLMVS
jgi:hypothetical protein